VYNIISKYDNKVYEGEETVYKLCNAAEDFKSSMCGKMQQRQTGGCTLAGYNKATRSCYLRVDVLDTTDETYGVFFYEPGQTGNTKCFTCKIILVVYNDKIYGQQKTLVLFINCNSVKTLYP